MALLVTGLGPGDVAETVECLRQCADRATDPELAEYRRHLADLLGDALDRLPTQAVEVAT
ncbi:hypothetical protein J7E96_28255 [Streptomyces sp. ISL-96]|uniref:hypothetical protein n=1 Tax=Streptomyces sp. ISL-96 TaxID=2819191 RepID=UPI001BEA13A1|nr:hypothetical protein [Streptomyces sp. ISL-96]MBT2492333.1 hypothetical protein [Streptomyces sp. ISL-96]